jgi:hypothetical protein
MRRAFRPVIAVGLGVTAIAACAGSTHSDVAVSGSLAWVGGAPLASTGAPGPCGFVHCIPNSEIKIYQGTSDQGRVVDTIRSDATGRYSVRLAPGTYFIESRPSADSVPCLSDGSVAVGTRPVHANVICNVK